MLYSSLNQFDESERYRIPLAVKAEAYARHAFILAGALQPLSHRPEFDTLFHSPRQEVLIEIGRNILKYLLGDGVMLGEAGELKDRIGTAEQFRRQILYDRPHAEALEYIKQSARRIDGTNPDDLRGIAIFALAEPEAFCDE